MSDTENEVEILETAMTRDEVLRRLSSIVKLQEKRVRRPRVRDVKKEDLKIKHYKAFVYSCNVYNAIYKDQQLDKLEKQVRFIKKNLIKENSDVAEAENIAVVEDTIRQLKENTRGISE